MIILDLDNTIADDSWRIEHIDWECENPDGRYHIYHLLAAFDEIGNKHLFEGKERIVIMTARPTFYAPITIEWLKRNGLVEFELYMRPDGCELHSSELKRAQLHHMFQFRGVKPEEIECAYDDRPDVIEMYKKNGVNAELVSIHNVCAYTKPQGGIH